MEEKKSSIGLIIGIIVVIALVWWGVSKKQAGPAKLEGPVKIGFVGPLTGEASNVGEASRAAVELAVKEINAAGGIGGQPMEVVYEDGQCDGKASVDAVTKLLNIDKVPAILGGACSGETLAAAPITEQAKKVLFSYCSSAPNVTQAGDYIFRDFPSDNFQGKFLADYSFNNLKLKKVAIAYCQNDYCIGVKDSFKQQFEALGGTVTTMEAFEKGSKDLRTQLTKIKATNPDAVYLAGYEDSIVAGAKQIKQLGLNVKVLGNDTFEDPKVWTGITNAKINEAYYSIAAPAQEGFQKKFKDTTGKEVTVCVPQAYDSVYILTDVIKRVGLDPEKIKTELYNVKDFPGVSGMISFDQNGDLTVPNYVIKQIKDGKAETIK